jgi:hypothetical protein
MGLPPYSGRPVDPEAQVLDLGQQIVSLLRKSHSSPLVWIAALDVARALLPVQELRRHLAPVASLTSEEDEER